jgi:hypothetical protein
MPTGAFLNRRNVAMGAVLLLANLYDDLFLSIIALPFWQILQSHPPVFASSLEAGNVFQV